jgi:hypothetical protein
MKMGRVCLDLNYIVDMDNQEMVERAYECLYEDLMQGVKYGNIGNWIDVIEDKNAKRRYDSRIFIGERK